MKNKNRYFTPVELGIFFGSIVLILAAFLIFDRGNYLTLVASLLGVTSLILCAKGNPIGPMIMIVFCLLYTYISYTFSYYGEMITYLGMSAPMSVFALCAWLKNPSEGKRSEVRAARLHAKDIAKMLLYTLVVTFVFYFILRALDTTNLIPSTLSITTSFAAAYLTYRRSPFFALAYATNDLVLIVLWILAALADASYVSVMICFLVFLVNDLYGFFNWLSMQKRQENTEKN